MISEIMVITELKDGHLRGVTEEILSFCSLQAKKNGVIVRALVVSDSITDDVYKEIVKWGVTEIISVESPELGEHNPELLVPAIAGIIKKFKPQVVLTGNTAGGKDLLPRLAQEVSGFMASDVIEIGISLEEVNLVRPIYGGQLLENIKVTSFPLYITVRPNVLGKHPRKVGKYHVMKTGGTGIKALSYVIRDIVESGKKERSLIEADIIVSGGGGLKCKEDFRLLETLADTLNAAVGASRKAVDEGLRPYPSQVGQTGKTVSPKLYIACGISGANQHLAGMAGSQVVVAINKNPDAPIFKAADYGIVGDLYKILPVLNSELRKILQKD